MTDRNRRKFLKDLATAASGVVLMPAVSACSSSAKQRAADEAAGTAVSMDVSLDEIPKVKPANWDPIAYNRIRGNAGAIPESYQDDINGPEGEEQHLGKHLPYLPEVEADKVPEGYVALMWGDPEKGYTRHPNAEPGPDNNYEGHWYNWIRIRKATEDDAIELQSEYTGWPGTRPDDSGAYAVFGEHDITSDSGKNTIYLAALPADVEKGDTVRIYAHCLTHGEYVDFITL
jgi:hypothetical protein